MIRKTIMWGLFVVFSTLCIAWLARLVLDATKTEALRRGAKALRSERAARGSGPIVIGVAGGWDVGYQSMLDGVNLAAEEINRAGGVRGRPIRIVAKNDQNSVVTGIKVAQELADNLDLVAVVGHPTSAVSLAVSTIYEYYGVLMVSPTATNPALTRRGHKMVFRTTPTDTAFGEQLAEYAHEKGYRRVAIYYLQDDYARGLANIFEKRCGELGIKVVDRMYFEASSQGPDFAGDLEIWKKQFQFDAIMLAGFLPQAAEVIKEIRRAGISVPILSGEALEKKELLTLAGRAAENTVVSGIFDPRENRGAVRAFINAFQAKYRVMPTTNAAKSYDALKLIAHVIEISGSSVPEKMAETLRSLHGWQGVTGTHSFDLNGDVVGKPSVLKIVRNGRFELVELRKR